MTVDLGALPEWDLSDLYPSPDSQRLAEDLDAAEAGAKAFHQSYAGQLAGLDGTRFGAAIAEYERLSEIMGRAMSYAQLWYAGNVTDPERGRFFQGISERITTISTQTLFFTLEINRLDDDVLAAKLGAPAASRYAPWLRDVRVFRPHQLSDDLERLLHEKSVAGRAAWTRLFDETMGRLRFPLGDAMLTSAEVLNLMSDGDGATRKAAAQSLGAVLGENAPLFALVTNTLAKDKEIEDTWRHYPSPQSYRNLSNQVEDAVVDALVAAVKGCYEQLSHRYYRLKARWFGSDQLDYWDRNAPLPDADERSWTWPQARDCVLGAYNRFSPELAAVGGKFFADAWIDAPVRPGKSPGAFAHPTVPSAHPYLLVNFLGKTRDVMTLAHELGHGCHQVLAAGQGALMADTPLTLAETASVFGEMLTFQALLAEETDPLRRKALLAGKVEDMLNTVVRQVAFYDFERQLHAERRAGELSPDRIGAIWMQVQGESLGPALRFHDEYRHFWSYIPHFVHSPFYVYAYAFGDCLVNSLYSVYRAGTPGFERAYLDLLKAGGTLRHKELLQPFGLDASDPKFWRQGLDVVVGFIDELEGM
ncbi:MAG: M3 family oligoendopeptidase [Magnetospirillum sp.]|nr:M3 family oligoendopeptidase [Magnetospirillum sp.]